jgi:hypothetical protein
MSEALPMFWKVCAVTAGVLVPALCSVVALVMLLGARRVLGGIGQIVALWLESKARAKAPTQERDG